MKMRFRFLMLVLATLPAAVAQSTKDSVKAVEIVLKERPRLMRGFNMASEVVWRWNGKTLVQDVPLARELAMIEVGSLKLHGTRLDMEGTRRELFRANDTAFELGKLATPVIVRIELGGAEPALVLPQLIDQLFYKNERAALAEIPPDFREMLPAEAKPGCCTARPPPNPPGCSAEGGGGPPPVTPPKLLKQVDPKFSDEAQQKHFSGDVQVGFRVNTKGAPTDLWLMRRVGMGLDENAVEAVSRYRFEPARCGDRPVPVTIYVNVNFQIF